MTDHDALLAALLANPADDTARLVYADWLEENAGESECPVCDSPFGTIPHPLCSRCSGTGRISNGFAQRAEFIRVQCELARWDWGPRYTEADHRVMKCECRGCGLRRRERELLDLWTDNHTMAWRSWSEPCHRLIVDSSNFYKWHETINFFRGFVSRITCSWSDWLQHADAIRAAQPVERVRLTTIPDIEYYIDRYHGNEIARIKTLMESDWPGIEFELPAARPMTSADMTDMFQETLRELGRMRFRDIATDLQRHSPRPRDPRQFIRPGGV